MIQPFAERYPVADSFLSVELTRLLQDSLGGNAYTLMIACVVREIVSVSMVDRSFATDFKRYSFLSVKSYHIEPRVRQRFWLSSCFLRNLHQKENLIKTLLFFSALDVTGNSI